MIHVRKFSPSDIMGCNLTFFNSSPECRLDGEAFSILDDNEVIAFIVCEHIELAHVHIFGFEVCHKGVGIGSKVIRMLQDCEGIEWITTNPLENSILFWEKMGFKYNGDCEWSWKRTQ